MLKYCFWLVALIVASGQAANVLRQTHSTKATGVLLCGTKPISDAVVRLSRSKSDDLDNVIATVKTNSEGHFTIQGDTESLEAEAAGIDPHLRIYHKCAINKKDEQKKYRLITLRYPREYVTLSTYPRRSYDVGTLNVQIKYPKETEIKEIEGWKSN